MKKQRDELRLALLDLLTQSPNEILETCEETEEEWGFIECINDKGQEIKLVFKENPVVEMYIDGIQQNGIE
jgi:hypothetical protein